MDRRGECVSFTSFWKDERMNAFRRNFGKPGSPYDFAAVDIGKLREKARELEEAQKGMKKKVNPKVLNMIDRCVLFSMWYSFAVLVANSENAALRRRSFP
jgi:hypothetical protein